MIKLGKWFRPLPTPRTMVPKVLIAIPFTDRRWPLSPELKIFECYPDTWFWMGKYLTLYIPERWSLAPF